MTGWLAVGWHFDIALAVVVVPAVLLAVGLSRRAGGPRR